MWVFSLTDCFSLNGPSPINFLYQVTIEYIFLYFEEAYYIPMLNLTSDVMVNVTSCLANVPFFKLVSARCVCL